MRQGLVEVDEWEAQIQVRIPPARGSLLDFVREGLNEGLQFRNPNVSAECGCGESFTV